MAKEMAKQIVFTVSEDSKTADGKRLYKIHTDHPRGKRENSDKIYADELYKEMTDITEYLNLEDYAVLFEIE